MDDRASLAAFALLIVAVACVPIAHADVVYIWSDGSIDRVEGAIISEVPGQTLRVRTADGREIDIAARDVANIVRDPISAREGSAQMDQSPSIAPVEPQLALAVAPRPPPRYREPSVAFLCSLLVPGGGQFYNGDPGSGALLLGGAVVGVLMIANANPYSSDYYSDIRLGESLLFGAALTSLIMAPIDAISSNRKNGFHAGVTPGGGVVVALSF